MKHSILQPYDCIDEFFNSLTLCETSEGFVNSFGVKELFDKQLSSNEVIENIAVFDPSSVGKFSPSSLVRYQGLIQDIYDPEFYCGGYECQAKDSGVRKLLLAKYRDIAPEVDEDLWDSEDIIAERTSMLCIPLPGATSWSRGDSCTTTAVCGTQGRSTNRKAKRSTDDPMCQIKESDETGDELLCSKRITKEAASTATPKSAAWDSLTSCALVRVYQGAEELRLHDMVEFVGIYTADPLLQEAIDGEDEETLGLRRFPPPSIAPRLHCITFRKLGSSFPLLMQVRQSGVDIGGENALATKCDFLLDKLGVERSLVADTAEPFRWSVVPMVNSKFVPSTSLSELQSKSSTSLTQLQDPATVLRVRSLALDLITSALNGDALAAEYVLLSVLSHVFARPDEVDAGLLGSLPVQLLGFAVNDSRVAALQKALSVFAPRCVLVPADSTALNEAPLALTRNYDHNTMSRSPLQLGAGSVLLIDMTTGNKDAPPLSAVGLQSVGVLRKLIGAQRLSVACGYSDVVVPTEMACVCLVAGPTSPLEGTEGLVSFPISATVPSAALQVVQLEVAEDDLHLLRMWWAAARLVETSMDDLVRSRAEAHFLQARQSSSVSGADFHRWLTIVRLVAVSYAQSTITTAHWEEMIRMEDQRIQRNVR